jgi:hypothetical protein
MTQTDLLGTVVETVLAASKHLRCEAGRQNVEAQNDPDRSDAR